MGSHSPKRHICDNLNQISAVESTSFKLGLFLHHLERDEAARRPAFIGTLNSVKCVNDSLTNCRRRGEKPTRERGSALFHVIILGKDASRRSGWGRPRQSFLFPLWLCFQSLFIRGMWAEHCVFAGLCAPPSAATLRLFAAHWAALIGLLQGGASCWGSG